MTSPQARRQFLRAAAGLAAVPGLPSLAVPLAGLAALAAQKTIAAANGTGNTWFCGAWMKNGFHEDGIASAWDVAQAMAERDTAQVDA